jgi:hypothetical protein
LGGPEVEANAAQLHVSLNWKATYHLVVSPGLTHDSSFVKPWAGSDARAITESELFPESALWNVGNTRPPQNLRDFEGDENERAYLIYFAAGDLHTYRHGTKVRVEGSTTHPAQLELLRDLFGSYGKPIYEPTRTPDGRYAIRATFDLSSSFDFLLKKPQKLQRLISQEDLLFCSALSGFSDAEGHVGLRRSGNRAYADYSVSNRKYQLIHDFAKGLISREHNARVYALHGKKIQWQLNIHGQYALKLLPIIGFRHREKIAARKIAMTQHSCPWGVAGTLYAAHRRIILAERNALGALAARRYHLRRDRRRIKNEIFEDRVASTFELFSKGLGAEQVAKALNCSIRTAYRRKEKFRKWKVNARSLDERT